MPNFHNPECFASHMGLWAIDPTYLASVLSAIRAGSMPVRDPSDMCMAVDALASAGGEVVETSAGGRYTRSAGLGVIRIDGPMQKGFSKFGGTSTVAARVALRAALDDKQVKAIMFAVDTPGGTVSGTQQFAEDVNAATRQKPVGAFVDDMMASAGVWAMAGVSNITAIPSANVGSVGAMALLEDTSGAAEAAGVQVHAITTGPFKAVGAPGVPVTDDHLAYMQNRVDGMGQMFFDAVNAGRGIDAERMKEIQSAKMYPATDAQRLGLVDDIGDFQSAARRLLDMAKPSSTAGRVAAARARARLMG